MDPVGRWQGEYTCIQGQTALELTIERMSSGQLKAVFHFGPLETNRGVPTGCFAMTGRFNPRSSTIRLDPNGWLSRPFGYEVVGLEGHLDDANASIDGRVTGPPGCTIFHIERSADTDDSEGVCQMPAWS